MIQSEFYSWNKGLFSVPGGQPKSTSTKWYAFDNEANCTNRPHKLYDKDSIEYKWNSYGFRSDEFEPDQDAILVIGCSKTLGVGVPLEHTWGHILRNKINKDYKLYNLSVGGVGGDYVSRALFKTVDVLKPKLVFILWPDISRREVQVGKEYLFYNVSDKSVKYPDLFLDDGYQIYQYHKNVAFANAVCSTANIPVIENYSVDFKRFLWEEVARDHQHDGLPWNEHVAESFYEKYVAFSNTVV